MASDTLQTPWFDILFLHLWFGVGSWAMKTNHSPRCTKVLPPSPCCIPFSAEISIPCEHWWDQHWPTLVTNSSIRPGNHVKFKSNITRLHFSIFRLVFHHVPWEIPMNQSDESPVPGFSLRKSPEISENAMPWQPPWRRGWCSARHIGLLSSPDMGSFRRCIILGEVEWNTLERFRTCEKYEGGWNSTLWKGGKNWRKQLKTLSRAAWHCTYHYDTVRITEKKITENSIQFKFKLDHIRNTIWNSALE